MNNSQTQNSTVQKTDSSFSQTFYAYNRYTPLFLGIAGAGFAILYILTLFNILGNPSIQLLYVGGALILSAIVSIPFARFSRDNRGIFSSFLSSLNFSVLAILITLVWEGVTPLSIVILLIIPATALLAGLPRQYYIQTSLVFIAGIVSVLFTNATAPFADRLQFSTPGSIAGALFLGATELLLITLTFVVRNNSFRSLRAHLITSFAIIVTIPALLATTLTAVGAYVNNEAQIINVLETVSRLKESQVNDIINIIKSDATKILEDATFSTNIIKVLIPNQTSVELQNIQKNITRRTLQDIRAASARNYQEIMVIDPGGNVVVSTNPDREGLNFRSQLFYRSGTIDTFFEFSRIPSFNDGKLILATPIYEGSVFRGILVMRTQESLIKNIIENTPGFTEMETYLLNSDLQPITKTRSITEIVNTQASQALSTNILLAEGSGVYENYAGDMVLGYYQRIEPLNAMFISEIPREFAIQSSLNSFLGGAILAFFAFIIAIVAVAVSAETIAGPIGGLAKTAESFADGELSVRASIPRKDEIGALGKAYDQMADQLQNIINQLEQRVADRTKAVEAQTLRLRTAAEVARDAAASHSLDEMLNKAGSLIQERFDLYHTGVFLLDSKNEFAVLVASPTEAGKKMITNSHKLRIGEVGIVGRVASTGEPRITLDTGLDAVHFNNPFLPKTRSEMALPLKVENKIIGVLDVQSDKQQAFNDQDIIIMQVLADQLAIAIERAQLFQQVEASLTELQQTYRRSTQEDWASISERSLLSNFGYRFDNVRIRPITDIGELGEAGNRINKDTERNDDIIRVKDGVAAIPIKLRGQPIGIVNVKLKDDYSTATVETIQQAVERLAGSLESARLFEEARLRADREQAIAQVTSSISAANEFDAILRTTVEQVGRTLGQTEVSIQIIGDSEESAK
jgi:GAF domain-containing protein/HAMP domain-containing protein